jgi:hypothetical protein
VGVVGCGGLSSDAHGKNRAFVCKVNVSHETIWKSNGVRR